MASKNRVSKPAERDTRIEIIASHFKEILETLGEQERPGLKGTPERFARFYMDELYCSGDPLEECLSAIFPEKTESREQVIARDIPFYSFCEHHALPYHGVAHVGYIPRDDLLGLSKIARLVKAASRGLTIQERVTTRVVEALDRKLRPTGVMVVIVATHTCMVCRGVEASGSDTVTSAVRGLYRDSEMARSEFLSLLSLGRTR